MHLRRPPVRLVVIAAAAFVATAAGMAGYVGLRDLQTRRELRARSAAIPRMTVGTQREWIATVVVNASCRFSKGDSLHMAVLRLQAVRDSLRRDTAAVLLRTRLIVIDPYAVAGDVGERWRSRFDEVIYGGSWSNTTLVSTVSLDTNAVLAVPALLVTRATLFRATRRIRRTDERFVLGALGTRAISDSLSLLVSRISAGGIALH